jgi:ATP-dependent Zn protease
MQHGDSEGKALYTRAELLSRIRTSLAGRAAEIAYYGEEDGISTGAGGDLCTATKVAEQMICNYAMDSHVGMSYIDANKIGASGPFRDRVNAILNDELKNAISLIEKNKAAIDALVNALMERNHLKENEIDAILSSADARS